MQKDIQSKGQEKIENNPMKEATEHKFKQVGHDINASLKENVGVGVGNYSSLQDRQMSQQHQQKYEENKQEIEQQKEQKEKQNFEETGKIGHKIQELGHTVNATLKQNVGIGIGNYPSEVDKEKAEEHQEKYQEKVEEDKGKINFDQKQSELKEKLFGGAKSETKESTGLIGNRLHEVGHTVNAKLKETIGVGVGDYSSEVDKQKANEHRETYCEQVKESSSTDVQESNPIVHKIKEVAHTVNANLKELIGVGVGNYSSEVDRELSEIHHQKYEEKIHPNTITNNNNNNTNQDQSFSNIPPPPPQQNLNPQQQILNPYIQNRETASDEMETSRKQTTGTHENKF